MAPEKDEKKITEQCVKEILLFKHCKIGDVPASFTSLHACERNFGFKYQVHIICHQMFKF